VLTRLTLLAALSVTLSPAQRSIDFEGRYWMPQMTARLRVEAAGLGTDIDARHDLGMPDTNFPQGSFTFHSAGHQFLRFTYTPIEFAGDQSVTRTIVYRGTPYTFGTRIVSDLQVRHLQLAWAYQFSARDGLVKIGPMLEADGFLMSSRLQAPALTPAIDQRESLSAGLPSVGLALDLNPHPRVNIYGQVAGMKAGSYGYFVGSDDGVKVRAWKGLFFTAGYRTFNLHVTSSPDFARLDMRGPFVGTGWRF
jgi:hypothetical protein